MAFPRVLRGFGRLSGAFPVLGRCVRFWAGFARWRVKSGLCVRDCARVDVLTIMQIARLPFGMSKTGCLDSRDAPPKKPAWRACRVDGSGVGPLVDALPPGWSPRWKAPKPRRLRFRQVLGETREETLANLRVVVERCRGVNDGAVAKATEIINAIEAAKPGDRPRNKWYAGGRWSGQLVPRVAGA